MPNRAKMGRHKTLNKEIVREIEWLGSLGVVKRIIMQGSEACRHGYPPGTLRVRSRTRGGLKVAAYGGNGVTNFYLNIDPIEAVADVEKAIKERARR